MNIDDHIQKNIKILEDPTVSPQLRRHTAEELSSIKLYKQNHPDDDHDPTSLELYCDAHPDAVECLIYND